MRLLWLPVFLAGLACAAAPEDVIVATRRAGRVEIFDSSTLRPLGTIAVNPLAESVAASPDGRTLFLNQAMPSRPNSCCGLFALDLERNTLRFLIDPSLRSTPSPDGRRLFVNRGNVGIDVIDAHTLARLPTIKAPGVYALSPSPDARWLIGLSNWPSPTADLFDVTAGMLVRRIPVPVETFGGGWSEGQFLLYGSDGHQGLLWTLTPESASLGTPLSVTAAGNPHAIAVTGKHVFLYEIFGSKVDRGDQDGVYEIEPATGTVLNRLAPGARFGRLAFSADGQSLYGIEVGSGWTNPKLVKVDRGTGKTAAERSLETDVWNLTIANIPPRLVPHGYVTPLSQ